MLDQLPYFV